MRVLSYNPNDDEFFVSVTWDEYRQLAAKYEIDAAGEDVEGVIESFKFFLEAQKEADAESDGFLYEEYIKDWYGIDEMPNICLIIKRDLSDFAVEQYNFPFHHLWNGYSPWKKIKTVAINDLSDLAALECMEKGRDDV